MSKNDFPKPFESGHLRARLVTILLTVGIVMDSIAIVSTFSQIGLLSRAIAGQRITDAEATANDALLGSIGIVQIIVYLTTAILFLKWIHRAHRNLQALGARSLKYSPGWAVGYWFIPIANLFRPYQVVNEIWKASDPDVEVSDTASWQNAATYPVLGWWWAFWLISNLVARASNSFSRQAKTLPNLSTMSWVSILSDGTSIFAAIFAILVVIRIDARQEEKNRRLAMSKS